MPLVATASQTVGPFFSVGLDWPGGGVLVDDQTLGERVALEGRVLDGDQAPVPDAMIEVWQANHGGRYAHPEDRRNQPLDPHFSGFGRVGTTADGRFAFHTIRPGAVPDPGGALQAPHIVVGLFARGLLKRLLTRVYFSDAANDADPVLQLVPAARRQTLVAQRRDGLPARYEWDIVLQGHRETVFFDG